MVRNSNPVSLSKAAGPSHARPFMCEGPQSTKQTARGLLAPGPRCTAGTASSLRTRGARSHPRGRRETSPPASHAQVRRRVRRAGELGLPGLAFTTKTPNPCSASAFSSDPLTGLGRGHHHLRPRCAGSGAAGARPPAPPRQDSPASADSGSGGRHGKGQARRQDRRGEARGPAVQTDRAATQRCAEGKRGSRPTLGTYALAQRAVPSARGPPNPQGSGTGARTARLTQTHEQHRLGCLLSHLRAQTRRRPQTA